jgi:ubiquinone/menaquinone biosynthesis C-methylase UbiE
MNAYLRKALYGLRQAALFVESRFDRNYIIADVPAAKNGSHRAWKDHLQEIGNQPGFRVLEIGSREVTGASDARERFGKADYVGFDYLPGPNVDVVGDAHKLSSYFNGQKFDLIYSSACFEHFAMPWVVAEEIAKLLKVGGTVFVETHFSYSAHERPWHFFQFSDMALRVLFPEAMGFECIEAGVSNPMVGRFSSLADAYLKNKPIPDLYCHSSYLGRKVREAHRFSWTTLDLTAVVGDTSYPSPRET